MSGFKTKQPAANPSVSIREMALSSGGALLGLLITVALARLLLAPSAQPFLVASMGATAVLLYAASNSPMAQPWAVFGGHIASALVGVTCARFVHDPAWAAALAGSGAILAMYLLRCMHPPGGATALMPIAAASVGELGYGYVLAPVAIDVVLMLALALLINHYLLRRPYPAARALGLQRQARVDGIDLTPVIQPAFAERDLQQALQQMDTYIDVTHQDLLRIYRLARLAAYGRRAGERRCSEFLRPAPAVLEFGTPLGEALQQVQAAGLPALPVVSRGGKVIGLMGPDDLRPHALGQPGADHAARVAALVTPSEGVHSDKPEAVGQVMNDRPLLATPDQPVRELLASLSDREPRLIPVVDAGNRLLGVIEPVALMAQLHRLAVSEESAPSAA